MRYYLIAGEASGDLHGSNLLKELQQEDSATDFRYWGGDLMAAVGGTLVRHYRDLAFMGFVEVVKNLRIILDNLAFCKKDILAYRPDVLILIDYPGFNLRVARWAKKQGIRVFYYISPQLWAWHSSRVKGIRQNIDRMFVILPFEEAFYQQYDLKVDFVGHPLLDVIDKYEVHPLPQAHDPRAVIALLPGSRRQEIERTLEIMLAVADRFTQYRFFVAGAPSIPAEFYQPLLAAHPNVQLVSGQTYNLLGQATAAIVTSGTATLETALFNVPQLVVYRGGQVSYWIARQVINVDYISLVNLIMDQPLLTELIQDDLTEDRLAQELTDLLQPSRVAAIHASYTTLRQKLGQRGASRRAAKLMVRYLHKE